ncbi:MAG: hypothetical protein ABSF38_15310 [Verrucomicrobiota bacterium]
MEDLLRAYAKKRREEAGPLPELSPHVRARLQQEVRRASGQSALPYRRRWGLPMNWWVRLAFGGAAAALILLIVWPRAQIDLKSRAVAQEAKKTAPPQRMLAATGQSKKVAEKPAAAPVAPAVPAPAAALPPGGGLVLDLHGALPGNPIAAPAAGQPSSDAINVSRAAPSISGTAAPATNAPSSLAALSDDAASRAAYDAGDVRLGIGGGGGGGGSGAGRGGRGGGSAIGGGIVEGRPPELAAAAPPKDALLGADKMAKTDVPPASPPGLALRMVRSNQPSGQMTFAMKNTAALPSAVLASFQIERTGQQIRVLDADGSVYQGQVANQVVMEKEPPPGNFAGANKAGAGAPPLQSSPQNTPPQQPALLGGFTFQVSGLNRTLNQKVTLTGSFSSAPLQQYANAFKAVAGEIQSQAANQSQTANNASPVANNAPQTANNLQNNIHNFNNSQQNILTMAQVWQVTGRVQIGPTNQFDLQAVTIQP